ncbi:MAG: metallophosphoesterase [Deltaproteobacteria bacterium]|nr:metallophosphoesterase [Candidatus Zymogenaceae bacterium]
MKVGVLSDTHLRVPDESFKRLMRERFSDVDAVIHAGDIVSPVVLDYLSAWELYAVAGNIDGWEITQHLPEKRVISLGGKDIGITHGGGAPGGLEERVLSAFNTVSCIVFGHSHNPVNKIKDGVLLFNPGSPTDPRYAKKNSIGYLTIGEDITGEIVYL